MELEELVLHITSLPGYKYCTVGGSATDTQPLPRELTDHPKQGRQQDSITQHAPASCTQTPVTEKNTGEDIGKRLRQMLQNAVQAKLAEQSSTAWATPTQPGHCSLMRIYTALQSLPAASL